MLPSQRPRLLHTFRIILCLLLAKTAMLAAASPAIAEEKSNPWHLPPGFRAELVTKMPEELGSIVSMTVDPQGRIIASAQYKGLVRITPADTGMNIQGQKAPARIERINIPLGSAQGLACVGNDLYVVVNGKGPKGNNTGLYRVKDTNSDGQWDHVELLRKISFKGGEHGPHDVTLSPDGKSLIIVCGNHTPITKFDKVLVAPWQEDYVTQRLWDPRGHAKNRFSPAGWIARTDLDGKSWDLISMGYRNAYRVAFNPEGELFTYDSDMEWDIGTPWYRPTRVCHVTQGSDYGWRSGTGKWPEHFPDTLPTVCELGPGSPTALLFGTGAKFPEKYRNAMFAGDWSYGQIDAVFLTPNGSSYTATSETFASAMPLPVTDMIVSPKDGAMYVALGGRRAESSLWRIVYDGEIAARDEDRKTSPEDVLRTTRQQIESLFANGKATQANPATIVMAWHYFGHEDRAIRYAARVAIELQPLDAWRSLALNEQGTEASITAMLALARAGNAADQSAVFARLAKLPWEELTRAQKLAVLRVFGISIARHKVTSAAARKSLLGTLDRQYPNADVTINSELVGLLVAARAPNVIGRSLQLAKEAATSQEVIIYLHALHAMTTDWTLGQRRDYLTWFQALANEKSGHSFFGYLENMRKVAIGAIPRHQRSSLGKLVGPLDTKTKVAVQTKHRDLVQEWKLDDLLPKIEPKQQGRSFAKGRKLFAEATCFKCHRVANEGGHVGPDLTGVGGRFSLRDILRSVVEPNHEISDQYRLTVFEVDGKTIIGQIVNVRADSIEVATDPIDPKTAVRIKLDDIEDQYPAPNSAMPSSLLDTFTEDEIADLMAYLRSGGKIDHPLFEKK